MRTYLDHNATSSLRPEAREAIVEALGETGNASSVHGEGRSARARVESAREQVAALCGAIPAMVTLTSGGTEANNLVIHGAPVERLIVSSIEHLSILDAAAASPLPVDIAPADADGTVNVDALAKLLGEGTGRALVSVMLANNETGAIQPVREIVAVARDHDALVHTDAVQAAGKLPLSFGVLGVDAMTISGHKLGGPQGTGALVVRDGVPIDPQTRGGGQEFSRRAGTENVAGLSGLGAAADAADAHQPEFSANVSKLRDRLERGLRDAAPDTVIFCEETSRLANTTCFAHAALSAEHLLMAFDLDGIAVSSGSACSSGKVKQSHVLAAMGIAPELANGAIRVSLGWDSCVEDVDRFLEIWQLITARHLARGAA